MAIISTVHIPIPSHLPDKFTVAIPRAGAIYGLTIEEGKLSMVGCFRKDSGERDLDIVIVQDGSDFEATDTSFVGSFRIDKVDIDNEGQERARHLSKENIARSVWRHVFLVSSPPTIIRTS